MTTHAGHAGELARDLDVTQYDVFSPIGGDGTVHEIANGFLSRPDYEDIKDQVTIGIVPGGTGNTLAYDLGIHTTELAAEYIIKGSVRRIDVGKVTPIVKNGEELAPHYSVNIIGYGLPSTVLSVANALRRLGGAQYKLAAYVSLLRNRGYKCRVEMVLEDGSEVVKEGKYVMIQGQTNVSMGSRTAFCPDAKLDDGLLDLVLIDHGRVLKMIKTFQTVEKGNRKHLDLKNVDAYKVKSFKVLPAAKNKLVGKEVVNVDGELIGHAPFEATTIQAALRVIAP